MQEKRAYPECFYSIFWVFPRLVDTIRYLQETSFIFLYYIINMSCMSINIGENFSIH
jgi:hypothetical protein